MKKYLFALLGGFLLSAMVWADDPPVEEDLYMTAMQSIAEVRRVHEREQGVAE